MQHYNCPLFKAFLFLETMYVQLLLSGRLMFACTFLFQSAPPTAENVIHPLPLFQRVKPRKPCEYIAKLWFNSWLIIWSYLSRKELLKTGIDRETEEKGEWIESDTYTWQAPEAPYGKAVRYYHAL